jgi:protein TonB
VRRWFALSGICHGGVLLALVLWPRTTTSAPRVVAFECQGLQEAVADIVPAEPDPPEPRRERLPDAWAEEQQDEDYVEIPEEFDAEILEAVEVPEVARACPLNVRLKRPLHEPRRQPAAAEPPAPIARATPPAPRAPAVAGAWRAPVPLGKPEHIPYPRRARRRGLEGTVVLIVHIDRTGYVDRIQVEQSSGHPILDEAARSAVATWRFLPALRNGVPVASWTRRSVHFRLTGADS